MATKSKTNTADTKAIVTPANSKAAAVNATTETKATAKSVANTESVDTTASKSVESAEKKTSAKKTAAKKPATKKATTAKKTTKKETEVVNATYVLQFSGKEVVASDILETVKKVWVEKFQGKLEEIKTIEIYIKPEENRAYFVVNGLSNGDYFVEL